MKKEVAMDMVRFEALADAYGADLRRWPAAERPAAEALLTQAPEARACLLAAEALDDLLAGSPAPSVGFALREAVLATAPKPRRSLFQGAGFWLSGAGLAAAGVAGLLVGTVASNALVHEVQTDSVLAEVLPDATVDILPLSRSAEGDVA